MATWLNRLSVGSHLEIVDKYDKWCVGIVKQIEHESNRIKISYYGWSSKWSEWIDTLSDDINRIAPSGTNILPFTFNTKPAATQRSITAKETKCCIWTKENCIICVFSDSQFKTLIIDKYFKSSNQYKRVRIRTDFALPYIIGIMLNEYKRQLSVLMCTSPSGTGLHSISVDLDTNKILNVSNITYGVKDGVVAYKYHDSLHIIHGLQCKLEYGPQGKKEMHHAVLNNNTIKYFEPILNLGSLIVPRRGDPKFVVDEHRSLIYAFDGKYHSNIHHIKITDDNGWEITENEAPVPSPEDTSFVLRYNHSMIYVYGCLILMMFRHCKSTDIWILDLRNKTWYKSESKMPYTFDSNVIDGMDNFIYFIFHGKNDEGYNFKISLFDIIPSEVYENGEEENYILVQGFMNGIGSKSELICPDSLLNVIAMYYPKLLYV